MTMKEKLRIHHQIEQENKAKLKKWKEERRKKSA
jgi:hypothetical protein